MEIFQESGFHYAEPLFIGTLEQCLKFPNAFQTKLPNKYNKEISYLFLIFSITDLGYLKYPIMNVKELLLNLIFLNFSEMVLG